MLSPVMPDEVIELRAGWPRWFDLFLGWAVRWSIRGPAWLPMAVRKVPLRFGAGVLSVYVRFWLMRRSFHAKSTR